MAKPFHGRYHALHADCGVQWQRRRVVGARNSIHEYLLYTQQLQDNVNHINNNGADIQLDVRESVATTPVCVIV